MIYVVIVNEDGKHWRYDYASADRELVLDALRTRAAANPTLVYRMQLVAPELFEALTADNPLD